ncbi:Chromodomain Y-like protein [Myotis davidii]|uniref:Chromodomain Y-like protein n=1 Tax=Myotis davidii TaxID=225400 RepID=L5LJZ5_MYODS|nr:Chromodomain Y-like protein [Myotis davidii]
MLCPDSVSQTIWYVNCNNDSSSFILLLLSSLTSLGFALDFFCSCVSKPFAYPFISAFCNPVAHFSTFLGLEILDCALRRHTEKQKESTLTRTNRTSPNNARKQISRSTNSNFSKTTPKSLVIGKDTESKNSQLFAASQKFRKNTTPSLSNRKNMDLAKSGIKILVPKSPIKSRTTVDGFQSESPEKLDPIEQGQEDTVAPEVAAEKPVGALLGPGAERARMGSRPRIHPLVPQVSGSVTAAMATGLAVNGKAFLKDLGF